MELIKRVTTNITHLLVISLTLVVLLASSIHRTAATAPASYKSYKAYVKTACNSTTYPTICYKSLSSHASAIKADPIKLCTTALNLNVKAAKEASSVVSKLLKKTQKTYGGGGLIGRFETLVLKDCIEEIKDTIDELKQATVEMKNLSRGPAERVTNARTWVSAALTDETTCTDGIDERKVNADTKKKVKKVMVNLGRMTSNTLALITALRY